MTTATRFLVLLLVLATSCAAPEPTLDERAQAIEGQVWSPYCPGRLLVDCTTAQAHQLRTNIEKRLRRGDSSTEVLAWIRSDFGSEALARPAPGTAGLAVWLVPFVIFLAGALVVGGFVRRWTKDRPAQPGEPPPDDTVRRVRDEVERDL